MNSCNSGKYSNGIPAELAHALQATHAPSDFADITASLLDAEINEKQKLLETIDTDERLQKMLQILTRRIEVLRQLSGCTV